MATSAPDRTEVGSYFVANYPPFSVWTKEAVQTAARPALASAPGDVPLGLYLHIPFCRKRCHFCYFRVYTDKNASDVQSYLDVLGREWELYNAERAIAGRPMNFVYFGGGTPSYISTRQLESLVARLDACAEGRDRAVDHAALHPHRVGHQPPAPRRLVVEVAHSGRAHPVGIEDDEVGGESRPEQAPVGEPQEPRLVAGQHGDGPFEGEHRSLPDPVLERPHRVAAVGVGQDMGAGVGRADDGFE